MGVITRDVYNQLSKQVQMGGSAAQAALKQLEGNTIAPDNVPTANVPAPSKPSIMSTSVPAPAFTNYQNAVNAPSSVPKPYGGADYNQSDAATRQSIQDNEARLSSDPNFVTSEISRTKSVLAGMNGQDTSAQTSYLNRLQGMVPKPPSQPTLGTPTSNTPAPSSAPYGQLNPSQIQAEAQARINKLIAERTRVANQTKQGYQTSFDRMNQRTQENRTLENTQNQRNLSPFSGHSDYAQGMIARERGMQDQQNQQDLQTRLGNVDGQLSDFLNQTPEQQQQIINDLTRQEREYGLQVGTLTGNLQGYGSTLAKQAQDAQYTGMYNGQMSLPAQLQIAGLTGQFNGQSTLQGKESNWNAYKDAVNMTGNMGSGPKADWGQLPGQQGAPSYAAQQQAFNNGLQQSGVTGYYNGQPTFDREQFNSQNTLANNKFSYEKDPTNPDNVYKNAQIGKLNSETGERGVEAEVMNHAQDFQSAQDVEEYFSANGAYLAQTLGAKGMQELKKTFQDQFKSGGTGKIDAITSKAISMAMSDPQWLMPDSDKQSIINKYKQIASASLGN